MSPVVKRRSRVRRPDWFNALKPFAQADTSEALGQLSITLVPYLLLWAGMLYLLDQNVAFVYIFPLILLASGFLVRTFIIFHDCTHGSFFKDQRANRIVGYLTGILTFTPFDQWQHSHDTHHATVADLDRRGTGDVWTMTVEEYQKASARTRFAYRLVRTPFFTFLVGAPLMFLFVQRIAAKDASPRERWSVIITNAALGAICILAALTIGLRQYLLIQLPVLYLAAAMGVWLFYVQHQFEGVYWARHDAWDPMRASLEGSSFYDLPPLLRWFTGNIGYHHLHHVQPRIPMYHLEQAYAAVPAVHVGQPLHLRSSLQSLRMNLYDEETGRMVSFLEQRN